MGKPDRLHSYSYTPDVAAGLIVLGNHPSAVGSVWHLPIAETWTTREVIEKVFSLNGTKRRSFAAGRTSLRLYGLIRPEMREYLHTLYQFTDDWVVSDAKFRATFGDRSTPLVDALAATVDWYRDRGADSTHPSEPDRTRT
jgi:nucleoside-diphosphate-sugar epimerase